MPGSYSVGTVFLNVIPSFKGVQQETKKDAEAYGRQFGSDAGKAASKSIAEEVNKNDKDAEKAGANYSGAFRRQFAAGVKGAMQDLGKEIDRTLGDAEKHLNKIGDIKFDAKFDSTKALAELRTLESRLSAASKDGLTIEGRFNAANALRQVQTFRQKVEKELAKNVEVKAALGGKFESELRSRVAAAKSSLPAIDIDVATDGAQAKIAEIQERLQFITDEKVGIDVDAATAIANVQAVKAELDTLAATGVDIDTRVNIESAAAELETLLTTFDGRAVDIKPNLGFGGEFITKASADLKAASAALPDVVLKGDATPVEQEIAVIRAELASLSGKRIDIDLPLGEFLDRVAAAQAALTALDAQNISPDMDVNVASALAKVTAVRNLAGQDIFTDIKLNEGAFVADFKGKVERAVRAIPDVPLRADASDAERELDQIRLKLIELRNTDFSVDVDGAEKATAEIEVLLNRANALDRADVDIRVRTDAARAAAELASVDAVAKRAGNNSALTANSFRAFNVVMLAAAAIGPILVPVLAAVAGGLLALVPAAGAAVVGIGALVLGFSGIGGALQAYSAQAKTAAKDADTAAKQVATAAEGVANAERGLAKARESAAEGTAAAARRVADAVTARSDAEEAGAKSIASAVRSVSDARAAQVKTEESGARAIVQAARSVRDAQASQVKAQESAARSIAAASRRVADARQGFADAQESASRSIESSLKRERNAQDAANKSQVDAVKAQRALLDARKEAAQEQEDLQTKIARGALDERQAVIDLFEATANAQSVNSDPGSTNLEKEEASIALGRQRLGIEEIRKENKALADQDAKFRKDGIEGTEKVLNAQERVRDAVRAQGEAQKAVAEAAQATARTRVDAERSVEAASRSLTDAVAGEGQARREAAEGAVAAAERVTDALAAQRQAGADAAEASVAAARRTSDAVAGEVEAREAAARSAVVAQQGVVDAEAALVKARRDGSEGVADAQRALSKAQDGYTEAINATSTAADNLADALSKLGPAGQAFALYLFGLRGTLFELRDAFQSGFLPGVTSFLQQILGVYGPGLNGFLTDLGRVMGDLFVRGGQFLTSDPLRKIFAGLAEVLPGLIVSLGGLTGALIENLFQAIVELAPLSTAFLEGFTDLMERFTDRQKDLDGNSGFQKFFDYVLKVAPDVRAFFNSLLGATVAIFAALAPFADSLLNAFTGFLDFIQSIPTDVLGFILVSIIAITVGLQVMFGIIAGAGAIAGVIVGVVAGIAALSGAIAAGAGAATILGIVFSTVFVPVLAAVAGLVIVAGIAFLAFGGHLDGLGGKFNAVTQGIASAWLFMVNTISAYYNAVLRPIFDAFATIVVGIYDNVIAPVFNLFATVFGQAARAISTIWNDVLKPVFLLMGAIIKEVWENIIKPIFGFIGDAFTVIGTIIKFIFTSVIGPVIELFAAIVVKLYEIFVKPYIDKISAAFTFLGNLIAAVYNEYIKPPLQKFMAFLKDDVFPVVKTIIGLIGDEFDKLREVAKKPIKFIVETIINKGLIKGFNVLADVFGTKKIPDLELPKGFATGGQIPGHSPSKTADNIPIWATAGEFMQPVDTVQYYGNSVMEAIRKRQIPREFFGAAGHASGGQIQGLAAGGSVRGSPTGGLVAFGRMMERAGILVNENPYFGTGRVGTHSPNSQHYSANAIDVNYDGKKVSEKTFLRPYGLAAQAAGFQVFFNVPGLPHAAGHDNHLHIGNPRGKQPAYGGSTDIVPGLSAGGEGQGGGILDGVLGGLTSIKDYFKDKVENLYDQANSTKFGALAIDGVKQYVTKATDYLGGFVGGIADSVVNTLGKVVGLGPEKPAEDGSVRAQVRSVASGYGWDKGAQWDALQWVIQHESEFNPTAKNPRSTAFGLFQFLDSTQKAYGITGSRDPREQSVAGLKYIKDRYKDPVGAQKFWKSHGYYAEGGEIQPEPQVPVNLFDTGGIVPPGLSGIMNLTGGNEHLAVMTPEQIHWAENRGAAGDTVNITVPVQSGMGAAEEVASAVEFGIRRHRTAGVYAGRR